MSPTLTIAALRKANACGLQGRVDDLSAHLGRTPADDEQIPLTTWWALESTSVADRFWSLRAAEPRQAGLVLGVRAACLAARRALPAARDQDRAVCLAAIEAAEAWCDNPCPGTANAAYAAYAAADAAYAAANAAYAAYAAVYATANAAYAAASAADAAARAADATYAAEREQQRADLDRLLLEAQ